MAKRSKNPARPSKLKPTASESENPTGTVNSSPANRTRTSYEKIGSMLPLPSDMYRRFSCERLMPSSEATSAWNTVHDAPEST